MLELDPIQFDKLDQWLDYISKLHPKKIDLGLNRIKQVAERLNLYPFKPYVITVAGTNGKGSTVGLLEAIYTQADYTVATMTSPHLYRFNERLRINGKELSDAEIIQAFKEVKSKCHDITLSYFEFVTLAGLYLFNSKKVQIAILEIGLGGRLDAVNIIDPDIAVITNVALDHTDYLGDNRESIGFEKAGILRTHIPFVFGEKQMPNTVKKLAKQNQNNIYQFGYDYSISQESSNTIYENLRTQKKLSFAKSKIKLENIANAITVTQIAQNYWPVSDQTIIKGIEELQIPGRCQIIATEPLQIFDVAHNPHGIAALHEFLQKTSVSGKTYGIFSMLETKDMMASIALIKEDIDIWYIAPFHDAVSHSVSAIQKALEQHDVTNHTSFNTTSEAYHSALQQADSEDRIVVFGSFHTVAEAQALRV